MNVHKRCQKNVANNCGINPKQIALLLQEMGISDPNTTPAKTTKPVSYSCVNLLRKLGHIQFRLFIVIFFF
jgi:hypothetical protein